ncbi:hypothetical protein [Roseomonas sp. USHLN139]|uniref:hypothetical protein n=1 Tax=Roseomonas sp. USHLN139 TaxID=3081298 RepID=UPI003B010EF9
MWADLVDEFLVQGQWSPYADDNAKDEALSTDFLRRLVKAYTEQPDSQDGRRALGLFVLALAVAEWGVRDPEAFEEKDSNGRLKDSDPKGARWKSDSNAVSGKHLMAYSIGGIGISHADDSEMVAFVNGAAKLPDLDEDQREALLRTVKTSRYKDGKVKFDQLRAAGLCREGAEIVGTDLLGLPFQHHEIRGGDQYCSRFFGSPQLTARDWAVFRTWARFALRRRDFQEWLLVRWMEKYWEKSIAQMQLGEGREEEAFINVRFRNSASNAADQFASSTDTPVEKRIAKQMVRYREVSGNRVVRRTDIIQRPVVLYRTLLGKPAIRTFRFAD